jgi:hypothetical protein
MITTHHPIALNAFSDPHGTVAADGPGSEAMAAGSGLAIGAARGATPGMALGGGRATRTEPRADPVHHRIWQVFGLAAPGLIAGQPFSDP